MTPIQKNMAPETKPCEIICTIAPSMPITASFQSLVTAWISNMMNMPSVTNPMCEIDE